MNKSLLLHQVLEHLEAELQRAHQAALSAHEAATHEENVAENKYDTLGLEAAYLASGQARRVAHLQQALLTWRQLRPRAFDADAAIGLGALIRLGDEDGSEQWLFLGPPGASMKLQQDGCSVQVLGNTAPLGQHLLGKRAGDDVRLPAPGGVQHLEVLSVE